MCISTKHLCVYVDMYLCMYADVRMYVCIYECKCVCIYTCVYVCLFIDRWLDRLMEECMNVYSIHASECSSVCFTVNVYLNGLILKLFSRHYPV